MNYPSEYEHVFRHLEKVRWTGKEWTAACPAHEDRRPSMTLRVGNQGLLAVCHAGEGCSFRDIQDAVSALACERVTFRPYNGKDTYPKRRRRMSVDRVWDYVDEDGQVLFQVVKAYDDEGNKRFWQRVPDDAQPTGWRNNIEGVRRVLYNLPALVANAALPPNERRMVLLVEGEKDACNLISMGLLATTASGGAKKFHMTELDPLAGCRVAVIPDVDPIDRKSGTRPGWQHAMQVCDCLWGKAQEIRVVSLPVVEGQDVSDWLVDFHEDVSPSDIKAALWKLVSSAPLYHPMRAGAPVPAFVLFTQEVLARERAGFNFPVHSPVEALGELDVAVCALRHELAQAKKDGKSPDRAKLLHRLASIAATAQRAAEDLQVLPHEISKKDSQEP